MRHFSRKRTVRGTRAWSRRSGSAAHSAGRYNSQLVGHTNVGPIKAVDTPTWQLPVFPSAPQYCRFTPTECVPCLGNPVSSTARMPARSGISACRRVQTGATAQGECVMKGCSA